MKRLLIGGWACEVFEEVLNGYQGFNILSLFLLWLSSLSLLAKIKSVVTKSAEALAVSEEP